jgi:hypothetical protein
MNNETPESPPGWAAWTDDVILEHHRCLSNPHDDVGILRKAAGTHGPEAWILASMPLASERDVQDGLAPEAGDPLSATSIVVSYCPFCGASL